MLFHCFRFISFVHRVEEVSKSSREGRMNTIRGILKLDFFPGARLKPVLFFFQISSRACPDDTFTTPVHSGHPLHSRKWNSIRRAVRGSLQVPLKSCLTEAFLTVARCLEAMASNSRVAPTLLAKYICSVYLE